MAVTVHGIIIISNGTTGSCNNEFVVYGRIRSYRILIENGDQDVVFDVIIQLYLKM
jgi:hypothetical protein